MFSCKFYEISENTFSYRTPPVAVSELFEQLNETKVFVLLIILVMFCENGKLPFLRLEYTCFRGKNSKNKCNLQKSLPKMLISLLASTGLVQSLPKKLDHGKIKNSRNLCRSLERIR